MDKPSLTNPDIYPNPKVLSRHLGKAKATWDAFVDEVEKDPTLQLVDWRFYNDGKVWLSRVMYKKKTVCWLSVWEKYFKVFFYFSEKSKDAKRATSAIDPSIKKQWAAKNQGKTNRGITILAKRKSDVKIIRKMMTVKAESL